MRTSFSESLMFVRYIRPEEDITGYVLDQSTCRIGEGYGLVSELLRTKGARMGWIYPSGLRIIVEACGEGVPPLDETINLHTRFRIYFSYCQGRDPYFSLQLAQAGKV